MEATESLYVKGLPGHSGPLSCQSHLNHVVPGKGQSLHIPGIWPLASSSNPLSGDCSSLLAPRHYAGTWDPEAAAPSVEVHQVCDLSLHSGAQTEQSPFKSDEWKLSASCFPRPTRCLFPKIPSFTTGSGFQKIKVNQSCRQLLLAAWRCSTTEAASPKPDPCLNRRKVGEGRRQET